MGNEPLEGEEAKFKKGNSWRWRDTMRNAACRNRLEQSAWNGTAEAPKGRTGLNEALITSITVVINSAEAGCLHDEG